MEIERFVDLRSLLRCPSVGMVTKPSAEQTQDFSIHNEDFPALPGPNYKDTTLNNDESKTVSASQWTHTTPPPPLKIIAKMH